MSWQIKYEKGNLSWNKKKTKLSRNEEITKAIKEHRGHLGISFVLWIMLIILGILVLVGNPLSSLKALDLNHKLLAGFGCVIIFVFWVLQWILMELEANHIEVLHFLKKEK